MEEPEYDDSYQQNLLGIQIQCDGSWEDLLMPSPVTRGTDDTSADIPLAVNNIPDEAESGNGSSAESCDDDISDGDTASDDESPSGTSRPLDLAMLTLIDDCDTQLPLQPIPDEYKVDEYGESVDFLPLEPDTLPDDSLAAACDSNAADNIGEFEEGKNEQNVDGSNTFVNYDVLKKFEFVKPNYGLRGRGRRSRRSLSSLSICLTFCKYDSVQRVARRFGFREVDEDDNWNLFWTDGCVSLSRIADMKKFQKVNHFPGMSEICRKDMLARNLKRMLRAFPKEYNIFPNTWCMPADYAELQDHARRRKNRTYILKPESGCQGRGIWVTRNIRDISPFERQLCQHYISKPFLIDGFKFDLRIYVLVTNCDPLRIFVFKDGLARFATAKYVEPCSRNVNNVFMHLTNYAVNKLSSQFIRNDELGGSKRRIRTINKWLVEHNFDVEKLWAAIDDVIAKTIISAHEALKQNYRTCFLNHDRGSACFEILGFDILLDRKLKPYVLEVNHSPSFHTDSKLDREIKEALIHDTLCIVNFDAISRRQCLEEEKRRLQLRLMPSKQSKKDRDAKGDVADKDVENFQDYLERYEDEHLGNFRRVFPPADGSKAYEKFFHTSGSLYQETAAHRARAECARQQREMIARKQEELDVLMKKRLGLRGESPESRKKKSTKPRLKAKKLTPSSSTMLDTRLPVDIIDREERERVSGLAQRANMLRGMGVVRILQNMFASSSSESSLTNIVAPTNNNNFRDYSQSTSRLCLPSEIKSAAATTVEISMRLTRRPNDPVMYDPNTSMPYGLPSGQSAAPVGCSGTVGAGDSEMRSRPPTGGIFPAFSAGANSNAKTGAEMSMLQWRGAIGSFDSSVSGHQMGLRLAGTVPQNVPIDILRLRTDNRRANYSGVLPNSPLRRLRNGGVIRPEAFDEETSQDDLLGLRGSAILPSKR